MNNTKIRTTTKDHCYLCDSKGSNLYKGLKDRLFGVKGVWNIDKCSNDDCGLLWLNPMPVAEDLPKLYETYYTHTHDPLPKEVNWLVQVFRDGCSDYLKKKYLYPYNSSFFSKLIATIIKFNPKWTANLDFSVFYLPAIPNGKLLEIGCGSGGMLKNMQDKGWDVTGVDFDKKSVSVAQNLGLNVYEGDISQLNLEKNSFDAIIMNHVIEHLPDPVTTLKLCNELLRSGGRLISITPNTNGLNHNKYNSNSRILEPPRHLFIYNKNSLKEVAIKAGFKKSSCFTSIHGFSGFSWASEQLLKSSQLRTDPKIPKNKLFFLSAKELISGYLLKLRLVEGDEVVLTARKK